MKYSEKMLSLTTEQLENLFKSGIYKITCLTNEKFYIGSASQRIGLNRTATGIYSRWINHFSTLERNCHRNRHLQNAWNKYGKENFEFRILEFCNNDKLLKREQYWIDLTDAVNKGFNILPFATTTAGRKVKEETKQYLSKLFKNKPRPQWLKEHLGKSVLQFDNCGNFIQEYYSLQEAQNSTGCPRQDVGKVCLGKLKTSKGFQWRYKKDFSEIPQKINPVDSGIYKCK